jgi:hypothetical protein
VHHYSPRISTLNTPPEPCLAAAIVSANSEEAKAVDAKSKVSIRMYFMVSSLIDIYKNYPTAAKAMQLRWGCAGGLWGRYSFEMGFKSIYPDTITITRTQHLPSPM